MVILLVQFAITFLLLLILAVLVIANKSKKQEISVGCSAQKRSNQATCACKDNQ